MKDKINSNTKAVKKKLIVIGGGAAGFFCAINAATLHPHMNIVILEKSSKLLAKVRISGGGRCNVTHACFSIDEMMKKYPRGGQFVRKAFHQFFTTDTIKWFEDRGVKIKKEPDGRMFPVSDSSQSIIDTLMKEVNQHSIEIMMNAEVKSFSKKEDRFLLKISGEREMETEYLCIASGGYPKAQMFDWLSESGHSFEEPVPSLFTFNMPGNEIVKLMGVSVPDVQVKINGTKLMERGPVLITHWGMSGPAIIRLSAWGARDLAKCNWHFTSLVNWLPDFSENSLREKFQQYRFSLATQKIVNKNPFGLPQRLWEYFIDEAGIKSDIQWANLPAKNQNLLIKQLVSGEFQVKGKTTFKEEFVTAGGVKLVEVDPNTMMSKKIENLYFAGEVLNVDGITGGFNFQHAWTSGFIAAKSIAQKATEVSEML